MVEMTENGTIAMPSTTHTCAACGLQMNVHERYLGRTLRCTGCGEPFVAGGSDEDGRPDQYDHTCLACGADMVVGIRFYGRELSCTECGEKFVARPPIRPSSEPSDAPAEAPPADEPLVDPARRSRIRRNVVLAAIVVVSLGLVLLWLGGDREQGFGSSLFQTQKARSQIGELRFETAPTVPVALDRDGVAKLEEIARAGEGPSARPAFESSDYLQIEAGTRVRVVETSRGGLARVRILSGPQNSRIVWVPIDWVE
jgi:predicted RNA-binding Zn-ribbon protein involved in translation (DUF1610 family)